MLLLPGFQRPEFLTCFPGRFLPLFRALKLRMTSCLFPARFLKSCFFPALQGFLAKKWMPVFLQGFLKALFFPAGFLFLFQAILKALTPETLLSFWRFL